MVGVVNFCKGDKPKYHPSDSKINMYYSPTKLELLYYRLEPKNGVQLTKLTEFASSALVTDEPIEFEE